MATKYGPTIVTDGLVLCLDAANTSSYSGSGTAWNDLIGGNTATKSGNASWNSSGWWEFRNVIDDGDHEYFSLNDSSNILKRNYETYTWSIEVWARLQDWGTTGNSPNAENFIIGKTGWHGGIMQWYTSSSISVNFRVHGTNSGESTDCSFGLTPTGNWYHFVAIYGDRTLKTYTNGVYKNTTSFSSPRIILYQDDNWRIAGYGTNYYRFNGDISIIRLYEGRELSATEVLQNYNANKGRYGL